MATYEELATLIPKLKRAAIDAYMVSDYGGAAGQMWSIEGDKYTMSDYSVTRPGSDGEGGGDWSGDWEWLLGGGKDEEFSGTFDNIRSRIDGAVDEWTANLPKEAEIKALTDSVHAAMMGLGLSPGESGGVVNATGPLGGYLTLISQGIDQMSGATIEAYKGKFLAQLSRVVANQYAMTVPIGGMLAAEQNLWREARQTVADTVQAALDAMNAVVAGSGPNWDILLKVAGWSVKGAGIFAQGGLKSATDVAGLGVEILAGTPAVKKATSSPGGTCESVLAALEKTMKELSDAILAEEQALQDNLDANQENMVKQVVGYDINKKDAELAINDAQAPEVEMIVTSPSIIAGITDQHMPNVATELGKAADALWEGYGGTELNRPGGIGLQNGPSYFGLLYQLFESIKNLQWEVEAGAKTLALAIADLHAADEASQKNLDAHRKKLEAGSTWEFTG
jgi:hypothetical protein